VAWWIDLGAPQEGAVGGFQPPPHVTAAISRALGLEPAASERAPG
jgi:hypothetical protein